MSSNSSSYTTSIYSIQGFDSTHAVHRVKILNHSLSKTPISSKIIQCGSFAVGGYQWAVLYKPNDISLYKNGKSYVSFALQLLSGGKDLHVILRFSLVDQNGKASQTMSSSFKYEKTGVHHGFKYFFPREDLEKKMYVKDDCFTFECGLRVFKQSFEELENKNAIVVPPSNLHQHFGNLLQSQEGVDVTFNVKGETFDAHKVILSARSSVFRAELFGSMIESRARCISIDDIEPEVFRVLLHFVYTDVLPHNEIDIPMAQHLLVAADRYDLDRMKLICEEKLVKSMNVETVGTTLALAEQHNCTDLRAICIEFIASPNILRRVLATDGFKHLIMSYPLISKEILERVDITRKV